MGGVSAAVLFLLELAGGRVSQIGLKGTRVSLIRTEVSLIRIKVFLFWRTDGCQATLFPKGTAQPLKRRLIAVANVELSRVCGNVEVSHIIAPPGNVEVPHITAPVNVELSHFIAPGHVELSHVCGNVEVSHIIAPWNYH